LSQAVPACAGELHSERHSCVCLRASWRLAAEASVAAFAEEWLNERRASMKPQGWAAYERALRLHVVPVLGDVLFPTLPVSTTRA